jgi:hypothetical protein
MYDVTPKVRQNNFRGSLHNRLILNFCAANTLTIVQKFHYLCAIKTSNYGRCQSYKIGTGRERANK